MIHTGILLADVVKDGLVSSWTFNANTIDGATLRDVWGNNHGTISGNPKIEKGIFGEALSFNGTDDYIDLGNNPSLDFDRDDAFSTEAWINPDRTFISVLLPAPFSPRMP